MVISMTTVIIRN